MSWDRSHPDQPLGELGPHFFILIPKAGFPRDVARSGQAVGRQRYHLHRWFSGCGLGSFHLCSISPSNLWANSWDELPRDSRYMSL